MSKDGLNIGNRMKRYEEVSVNYLPHRLPVILRVDGKAFHSLTKRLFGRAWNKDMVDFMEQTAKYVQDNIQGCDFAYCQSDEISFLLTDYRTIRTDAWFSYNVSKMVSVSASLASSIFSLVADEPVQFDSRVFTLPTDEVCNYFVWRQIDATRNAISMAAREFYSHKELFGKNQKDMQELLYEKGINFNDYPVVRKRGFCVIRGKVEEEPPIFSKNREYVEQFVNIRED